MNWYRPRRTIVDFWFWPWSYDKCSKLMVGCLDLLLKAHVGLMVCDVVVLTVAGCRTGVFPIAY